MHITEFDRLTMDEALQMAKSLLPYLPMQMQKTFGIMIKLQELMNTIRLYGNDGIIMAPKSLDGPGGIIDILGAGLPEETRESMKMMQQMMQMNDILGMMAPTGETADGKGNDEGNGGGDDIHEGSHDGNDNNGDGNHESSHGGNDSSGGGSHENSHGGNDSSGGGSHENSHNGSPQDMLSSMMDTQQMHLYEEYMRLLDSAIT
jgi:hypothetical protein